MKLEQQVVSLELAQKLKELGVKQESLFTWIFDLHHNYWRIADAMGDIMKNDRWKWCAAFTVAELGEMLPVTLAPFAAEIRLDCRKCYSGWSLYYCAWADERKVIYSESADTEADARAKMLIYLIENNLLP